jgi:hypothetical protein
MGSVAWPIRKCHTVALSRIWPNERSGRWGVKQMTVGKLEKITGAVVALTAVSTAIPQGRPVSTVIEIAILGATLICSTVYVWRKRARAGSYYYGAKTRWLLAVLLVTAIVSSAVIASTSSGRKATKYKVLGVHHDPIPLSSTSLAIGDGGSKWLLSFAVRNRSSDDVQVKKMQVHIEANSDTYVECLAETDDYEIHDEIVMSTEERSEFSGRITSSNGSAPPFDVAASGRITTSCETGYLDLTFSPGSILEAGQARIIYIGIPKKLKVSRVTVTHFDGHRTISTGPSQTSFDLSLKGSGPNTDGVEILAPRAALVISVEATTNVANAQISVCDELEGTQAMVGAVSGCKDR